MDSEWLSNFSSLEAFVRSQAVDEANVADTVEALRFAILLLVSFPMSLVLRWGPSSPNFKHIFSFVSSTLLTIWVFDWNAFGVLFTSALLVFGLAKWQTSKPEISFLAVFIVLSWVQARVQFFPIKGYSDYSSLIMIMIIKLSSYAYWYSFFLISSCFDGTMPKDRLDSYQLKHAIAVQPNLIEFLGFSFNLVGFWVGPALEFDHYRTFTQGLAPYSKLNPKVWWHACKCFLAGAIMIGLYETLNKTWHFTHCSSNRFLLEMTFWQRYCYLVRLIFLG
jgi:hypothetical protein